MQRIDVDGVPVFTAPGPERVSATLFFAVGLRDETFATIGVTHLVEHLAMGSLPRSHLRANASVDVDTTAFSATGRPDAVAAFLGGVCRALADLPTDRLEQEAGVLEAEGSSAGSSTAAALWAARFGLTGPGLAVSDGAGTRHLSARLVREHAARWFTRGNAALAWHGEVPAGLRLPLAAGDRPARPRPEPRSQQGPVWTAGPGGGVGLLLATGDPRDAALGIGVDVLQERLRDVARHARGLSYHVDTAFLDLAPDHREVAVVLDARGGQEAEVARVLWEQYRSLAAEGPAEAEVSHAVAGFDEVLDVPAEELAGHELHRAALAWVQGDPARPIAEVQADWRAVTAQAVARALAAAEPSALLHLPAGAELGEVGGAIAHRHACGVLPALPPGRTFRPPALTRAFVKGARTALVLGDEVLAHQDGTGQVHAIAWDDVEAVVVEEEAKSFSVIGRDLCVVFVHADLYGRRAYEAVRARLAGHTWLA